MSDMSDMLEMLKSDFGGPIEEKVSGLEGCHVAFELRLRCDGKLGCQTCRTCWRC